MSTEIAATRRPRKSRPGRDGRGHHAAARAEDGLDRRELLGFITAFKKGDFSVRLPTHLGGVDGKIADALNDLIDLNGRLAGELTRVARVVGEEGRITQRASIGNVSGLWAASIDGVNSLISDLVYPTSETARVIGAVARGDLSQTMALEVDGRPLQGEFLRTAKTMNVMVDQLNSFASEVTRVAREVGTEGKLGGQAVVKGISGTWKDLTENVNQMAGNLTSQVRGIAKVVTAVANGDLKRKLTVEAKGEIAELADTINGMIETLAIFADQVTTVAREVGVEGQLGGQASVPGAAGIWKDLTENVNQLAQNLTTQMRAIAEVATAVTTGDLTRSIAVDARGEVAALKDYINEMIRHLRDTTQKNTDQDWLKTNLAKFSRMLQGQKDLLTVGRLILSELAPVVYAQHGVFYILDTSGPEPELRLLASYAHRERKSVGNRFKLGEGLVGQAVLEKDKIVLTSIPADYVRISSGLGEATPVNVIVLPVIFEGQVKAVLELASLDRFNPTQHAFLDQLAETIGIVLNTIEANTRTEDLLTQSQSLASELQRQQEELRQTNQQLEEKAGLLAQQNVEVERKNQEIEQARQGIEEKAKQLALTSKYKSEFVANMSHELRTPLNSLLILSDQLAKNAEGNLSLKQMQFAKTIHSSGKDLLMLINDILDLAKIESGTVAVDAGEVRFTDLQAFVERTFRHVAEAKKLGFSISVADGLPRSMYTDSKRVQQVIKNLLSNAFKFTERGQVELSIAAAPSGWNREIDSLNRAGVVVALSVRDTGIGIPASKHGIIFEAFQQADGSTSRRYGGTGLGLAISREIAHVLGGEITLGSSPGEGSTFTLFLPQNYVAPPGATRRPVELELQARRVRVVEPLEVAPAVEAAPEEIPSDDRREIQPDDRVLLVVDNDESFARCVLDAAHETGWRVLLASSGSAAVALVREFEPDAISLDLRLPDIDGFRILRLLKTDLETRHLPVLVISTDDAAPRAYELGASAVLAKPISTQETLEAALAQLRDRVDRTSHEILLVSTDDERAAAWAELLGGPDVTPRRATAGKDALRFLEQGTFDCAVIDTQLTDMSVDDLIAAIRSGHDDPTPALPVVRYVPTASDLRGERPTLDAGQLRAASSEELLDFTMLVLHRRVSMLPRPQRDLLESFQAHADDLAGRTALVVDDDVRNIFALSSVLEREGMTVLSAENGQSAIDMLRKDPGVDVVLMDIMMPGMDGFETIRAMRKMPELRSLPIVAVTAKAMKTDRESAIRAGAWDYLAKPVEPNRMLALLRSWLR